MNGALQVLHVWYFQNIVALQSALKSLIISTANRLL